MGLRERVIQLEGFQRVPFACLEGWQGRDPSLDRARKVGISQTVPRGGVIRLGRSRLLKRFLALFEFVAKIKVPSAQISIVGFWADVALGPGRNRRDHSAQDDRALHVMRDFLIMGP